MMTVEAGRTQQWQGGTWQPRPAGGGPGPDAARAGRALIVINPNSSAHVTDGIAAALTPLEAWGLPIRCVTLAEGPPGIETDAEAAEVVPPLLALAARLEGEALGFSIACFSDPGLHALRSRTALPVTGTGEAAYLAAIGLGERFGVISVRSGSIPRHLRYIRSLGLMARCAGDRALDIGVADLAGSPETAPRMIEVAERLRDDDGADVLVLGCAGMAHLRATLEDAVGLPVVEPSQAGAAQALTRIALGLVTAR
ncbi:MAG: aspartate/glutamate racemase family protein [Pseudomonadota bacterium]